MKNFIPFMIVVLTLFGLASICDQTGTCTVSTGCDSRGMDCSHTVTYDCDYCPKSCELIKGCKCDYRPKSYGWYQHEMIIAYAGIGAANLVCSFSSE